MGQAFHFSFPIERHVATVRNSGTEADLVIDNVSFRGLYYAGVQAYTGSEAHEIQIEGQRDPYLSKLWSMTPEQRQAEHKQRVEQIQKSFGLEKPQDLLVMDSVETVTRQTKAEDFLDFEQHEPPAVSQQAGPVKPSMEALYALDPPSNARPAQPDAFNRQPPSEDLLDFSQPRQVSSLLEDTSPAQPTPSLNLLDFGAGPAPTSSPFQPPLDLFSSPPQTQTSFDLFAAPTSAPPVSIKAKEEAEFDKLFS